MDPIILAPAGSPESVTAAVRCGADAVYLGAKHFNARRNAENFDDSSLAETVRYCHERGCLVYVTVNTLITDDELPLLAEEGDLIARSGADAVIIQDPAVMAFFRGAYPELPRHASTQTVVHNLDGALYLQDLGYKTAVLARELSLKEMEHICSHVSMKCEAFVHGAHCMSVSGACYLSAMLGGRSGNRGLCAQPCRLEWKCGGTDHALSLKDMSLLKHVRSMADAGVGILKIEGRMKRPEYVAAVVSACRSALKGEAYDEEQLRSVFSRSGFTDGYLTGKRGSDMFGYRTKDDVVRADGVLKDLAALYQKETPRVSIGMDFRADAEGSRLLVTDGTHAVTSEGPVPETALNRPTDAEGARKNLTKTGGTPYAVDRFDADIAPGLMLPASALNAMRRGALEALAAQRGEIRPWAKDPDYRLPSAEKRPARSGESALWARFPVSPDPETAAPFARIILPVTALTPDIIEQWGDRLIGELPAVIWPEHEEAAERQLRALRDAGLREVMADNIYGIPLARRLGLRLHGGMGLNILNTQTLKHYEAEGFESLTASFECSADRLRTLGGAAELGMAAYGRLPLMRFRACPIRAQLGCGKCGGHGSLTDRKGIVFPVECGDKQYSTLLNSVPLHTAERDLRFADHLLLYFTRETPQEIRRITEDFLLRRKSSAPRTGGLYYRELL